MIGEQRPGKAVGVGFIDDRVQLGKKAVAVKIIWKDKLFFDPAADHPVKDAAAFIAGSSWRVLAVSCSQKKTEPAKLKAVVLVHDRG